MTTTLAAQAVGSTVTLKVDGSDTAFVVVHQGNPQPPASTTPAAKAPGC